MSWSRMSRPTEDEQARCLSVLGGGHLALSVHQICQSIAPRHFFSPPPPSHGASRHHGGQGAKKPRVTVLAFRHKPPPAKDRSENWLLPRSRLAGAAGRADWFETTHQDKPRTRVSLARIKRLWPGGNPPPFARSLPHTPTLSLSLISTSPNDNCSKISRPPPNEEWRPETDQER